MVELALPDPEVIVVLVVSCRGARPRPRALVARPLPLLPLYFMKADDVSYPNSDENTNTKTNTEINTKTSKGRT